jgi:galactokinase/mevalonate kinase-like predicted kinase
LFDRLLPIYLSLPEPADGAGQVVITSGDVLLRFEPADARFAAEGITGLACYATPEQASRHGVFCREKNDKVRLYLQKPSAAKQKENGAINTYGQSCLDIGVMNFDAATAVKMLEVFGTSAGKDGKLALSGKMGRAVLERGLDFYREICCAMGSKATKSEHAESALNSGSKWTKNQLGKLFKAFSPVPFSMKLLRHCDFIDFGTSRAIIDSGRRMLQEDRGVSHVQTFLDINNEITGKGIVKGTSSWVEGCRINSSLTLGGGNLVVGVDIDEPLSLSPGTCLDVIKGRNRKGRRAWFIRCYNLDDTFKDTIKENSSFCGHNVFEWLNTVGAEPEELWDENLPAENRSIWNARFFPAVKTHTQYKKWLWMFNPAGARDEDFKTWRKSDRYNLEQILSLADHRDFHKRRHDIRAKIIKKSFRQAFHPQSEFSSSELAYLLNNVEDLSAWISEILIEAHRHFRNIDNRSIESLAFPRIIHTLGSALVELYEDTAVPLSKALPELKQLLNPTQRHWLVSLGLGLNAKSSVVQWARRAQSIAFESLEKAIIAGGAGQDKCPRSVLRSDEIVWARAPARLDVGGGWTDTPPYSLEHGGCVTNAAVNLNGQPPIQAYARVVDKPVIRISSIDLGAQTEITCFDQLMDYRKAASGFALAKAGLVLSGLSPERKGGNKNISLKKVLERFGGGIELTTLAAIPKGSGLGTSSIMGAVVLAAIQRIMGIELSQRQFFYSVLCLEQALTTGGGWQDQIGGVTNGVKMIKTEPGFVPNARIHYVLPDILDPKTNGGRSLLYYTGVTRLAKNILQQVVGRYLNRQRATTATLKQIHKIAEEVTDALIRKDITKFGHLVDIAWQLNKQLDPNSSNNEIESLFERVQPFIYGAKLLGAGGGGFMLMICKSAEDARSVREILEVEPPNERARFFDFDISDEGLTVSVC